MNFKVLSNGDYIALATSMDQEGIKPDTEKLAQRNILVDERTPYNMLGPGRYDSLPGLVKLVNPSALRSISVPQWHGG